MHKKSLISAAACTLALIGLSTAPAMAAGQIEKGPDHAKSICSFSGLNDTPDADYPEGGRVQSFGQLVSNGAIDATDQANVERPGVLCNPNNLPLK